MNEKYGEGMSMEARGAGSRLNWLVPRSWVLVHVTVGFFLVGPELMASQDVGPFDGRKGGSDLDAIAHGMTATDDDGDIACSDTRYSSIGRKLRWLFMGARPVRLSAWGRGSGGDKLIQALKRRSDVLVLDLSVDKIRRGVAIRAIRLLRSPRFGLVLSWYGRSPTKAEVRDLLVAGGQRMVGLSLHGKLDNDHMRALRDQKQLELLDIAGNQVSDRGIAELAGLKRLQYLDLAVTQTTDHGLSKLAPMPNLRWLDVSRTLVFQPGRALRYPKTLQVLHLYRTSIRDMDLEDISRLSGLRTLTLGRTLVRGAGLQYLVHLQHLETLSLLGTRVDDSGLRWVSQMRKLRNLDLRDTRVTDAGLQYLGRLSDMESLDLGGTHVTGRGLGYLERLQHLRVLSLWRSMFHEDRGAVIDDGAMMHVSRLRSLVALDLTSTSVTGAGLRWLGVLSRLKRLQLDNTGIDDDGLRALSGLKGLEYLSLSRTNITDVGIRHLLRLRKLRCLDLSETHVTGRGLRILSRMDSLRMIRIPGKRVSKAAIRRFRLRHSRCVVKIHF